MMRARRHISPALVAISVIALVYLMFGDVADATQLAAPTGEAADASAAGSLVFAVSLLVVISIGAVVAFKARRSRKW